VQVAGTHGPNSVGGNTGTPKNRAQVSLDWERGPLTATLTANWVSSFSVLDPTIGANDCFHGITEGAGRFNYFNTDEENPPPSGLCKVPSFASTDLTVSYKLGKNWLLKGSIQNLFDRAPPVDIATYGNASILTAYNPAFHQAGAVGRFFNIGASYTF
jgi:iron complex outermembrane receptor protein